MDIERDSIQRGHREVTLHFHTAPGSTEMYLIPDYLLDNYVIWCTKCDLYDERWVQFKKYFAVHEIVYKNRE